MPLVYKATNINNGKFYIGMTSRTLAARRANHFWDSKIKRGNVPKFHNAIRKHGEEAFVFEILVETETADEAMAAERDAVATLHPHYNILAGGYGPTGRKWSEKQRSLIIGALKGRKRSPELIAKVKATRANREYGRAVLCLDDGIRHANSREAAKYYGVNDNCIRSICYGFYQRTKDGRHFCFFEREMAESERMSTIAALAATTTEKKALAGVSRRRPVVNANTGVTFDSARAAAKALGVTPSRVMQLCQTGGATQTGLRMTYADELDVVKIPKPKKIKFNGTTGITGVFKVREGAYRAYVDRRGSRIRLGTYSTAEMAKAVRDKFLES